jgi:hypothetical protein
MKNGRKLQSSATNSITTVINEGLYPDEEDRWQKPKDGPLL